MGALCAGVLGAFGAHALKATLSADMLAVYQTGVTYQMWHALGLLGHRLIATIGFQLKVNRLGGLAYVCRNPAVFRQFVPVGLVGTALAGYDNPLRRSVFPKRLVIALPFRPQEKKQKVHVMRDANPQTIYLKDYQVPDYLIKPLTST